MKTLKIKDICDKGSSALKQKDVEGKEGKYPVFGASGYISSIDTYHQDKDYIAIVKDGSGIGRVSFMPAYSSVIGTMQYILPKEGYNIKYISYCLQSLDLAKYKQGAAIPHIYFRDYGERYVNIEESLPEQERIVSLLDAEFAKIDAIKANAEKQLQDAKALFQSILCNLLSNDSWSYSTIGEVFKTYSGGTPHKSNKDYYENGSIPWINSGEVCQKYIETTNNFITEKGLKNSSAKYYPVNTVLVAMYGATAAQSGILKFEATSNQAVCGLLPNKNYVPEFVYYWFVYNKEKVASMAQGGAQPNLSQVKIKTINIPLISLEDQHQIAEQLDKISAKIHALQSNFDTTVTLCNDLKQSILKDIFG
jgi:type I restriction enzyme S subunit